MSLILPRNPFAFPGGVLPGINPNHVALSGGSACLFSGVARTGGFTDLTRGVPGTTAGTPTRVIDGSIGDSTQYSAAAAHTFANRATTIPQMTFGAVVKWSNFAASSFSFIFSNSSNNTGYNAFFAGSDGSLGIRLGGANSTTASGLITNNIPYFVAASVFPSGSATNNFVVRRLDTGQLLTATVGSNTGGDTPNGTYVVGNWPLVSSFGLVGKIAAVAYTNAYLSMAQLRQWATAPWDFWYPPTLGSMIMTSAGRASGTSGGGAQARAMILA